VLVLVQALAQEVGRSSAGSRTLRAALPRRSVFHLIYDPTSDGGEGREMTRSVNCEFFGLDRFGLVCPPSPGLETIRNQTLPRAITD
jgi:hypothetical protein